MDTTEMPQASLLPGFQDVHKQAVLDELRCAGVQIHTWDDNLVDNNAPAIWNKYNFDSAPTLLEAYCQVSFVEDVGCDWEDVDRPLFAGRILGSEYFSLVRLETSSSYLFDYIHVHGAVDERGYPTLVKPYKVSEDAGAPIKELTISLHDTYGNGYVQTNIATWATILVCPELPPVAVRCSDVDKTKACLGEPVSDVRMIDEVERFMGSKAVDYLSSETCQAILNAVNTTDSMLTTYPYGLVGYGTR